MGTSLGKTTHTLDLDQSKHIPTNFPSTTRGLFGLRENPTTGNLEELTLCMGDDELCPGALAGQDIAPFITSLGEDEGRELYIIGTSVPSVDVPVGVVYQLVDPAR